MSGFSFCPNPVPYGGLAASLSSPIIQKVTKKAATVTAMGRQRAFSSGATNANAATVATSRMTTSMAFRHNLIAKARQISIVADIQTQEKTEGVQPYKGKLIRAYPC